MVLIAGTAGQLVSQPLKRSFKQMIDFLFDRLN